MTALAIAALIFFAPEAKVDQDQLLIQGSWKCTEVTVDGKPSKDKVGDIFKFSEDTIVISGKRTDDAGYTLDPSTTPKSINISPKEEGADAMVLGIYELEGEKLKLCFGRPGQERPEAFESKDGQRRILAVFERTETEK